MEADEANFDPPLQDVFNVWGLRFTSQCVGGYCGGVKMWVNGQPNSQLGTVQAEGARRDHDRRGHAAAELQARPELQVPRGRVAGTTIPRKRRAIRAVQA